jgi:hypothetical protein
MLKGKGFMFQVFTCEIPKASRTNENVRHIGFNVKSGMTFDQIPVFGIEIEIALNLDCGHLIHREFDY